MPTCKKFLQPLHHLKKQPEDRWRHMALSQSRQTSLFWRGMTTPACAAAAHDAGLGRALGRSRIVRDGVVGEAVLDRLEGESGTSLMSTRMLALRDMVFFALRGGLRTGSELFVSSRDIFGCSGHSACVGDIEIFFNALTALNSRIRRSHRTGVGGPRGRPEGSWIALAAWRLTIGTRAAVQLKRCGRPLLVGV